METSLLHTLFESFAFPTIMAAAAVFTRLSALFFFLPGVGERAVSVRVRLAAALAVTLILAPAVLPKTPETISLSQAALMVSAEAVVGALIGFSIRIAIFTVQTAGAIASQSFSLAQLFSAGMSAEPESPIATLLMFAGIVLVLTSGLHIEAIRVLIVSYDVLPLGAFPGAGETGEWAAERAAISFATALSLAMPFVVLGFIYNLAIGAANRAMPQLMVAFVGIPAVSLAGLVLLAMTAPILLHIWIGFVDESVAALLEQLR